MKTSIKQRLLLIIGVLITLMLWGAAFALFGRVLVSMWVPFGIGVIFAGLFAGPMWYKLIFPRCVGRGVWCRIVGAIWYAAVAIPFGMNLILGLNEIPQKGSRQEIQAVVSAKYTRMENEYRTVGRRRIYNGQHPTYYVELTLPDGHKKDYRVPARIFAKTRRGHQVKMTLHRGLLGFDVIERTSLYL